MVRTVRMKMKIAMNSLFVVLLALFTSEHTHGSTEANGETNLVNDSEDMLTSSNRQTEDSFRSFLARGGGGGIRLPTGVRDAAHVREAILSGNWERFTPLPVAEPNCHAEVQVVQRLPGRCIRLANGLPACQTEHYLSILSEECS